MCDFVIYTRATKQSIQTNATKSTLNITFGVAVIKTNR